MLRRPSGLLMYVLNIQKRGHLKCYSPGAHIRSPITLARIVTVRLTAYSSNSTNELIFVVCFLQYCKPIISHINPFYPHMGSQVGLVVPQLVDVASGVSLFSSWVIEHIAALGSRASILCKEDS